jgi:hypothetical protein
MFSVQFALALRMIFSKVELHSRGAWLGHPQEATEDRALPIRSRPSYKILGCNTASLALRPCDVKELSLAKVHGTKVLSLSFRLICLDFPPWRAQHLRVVVKGRLKSFRKVLAIEDAAATQPARVDSLQHCSRGERGRSKTSALGPACGRSNAKSRGEGYGRYIPLSSAARRLGSPNRREGFAL